MTVAKVFDREYIKETLSGRVTEEWNGTSVSLPGFLNVTGEKEKKENERRFTGYMERLEKQLDSFPRFAGLFGRGKRWRKKTFSLLNEILSGEPLLMAEGGISVGMLDGFKEEAGAFLRRAREFAPELGVEDLGQALRNYLVYAIFRELNGMPQKCTQAIFGYSMLYPYTDNFIDGPGRTAQEKEHYNRLIADKLSGRAYEAVSEYEEKTARLLSAIEEDFDRTDEIFEGLLLMLEAQRDSQRQADVQETVPESQALAISVYKGGLSVLIDRYLTGRPLTEKDLSFYYGFGFLLQLCDDLQDISQDRENGSRTVFSVSRSKAETEGKINRLLHYTKRLFEDCECRSEGFKGFLFDNCCLLILFSALGSREHVSEEWTAWAAKRIPVTVEYFDRLGESFRGEKLKDKKESYERIMDVLL